MSRNAETQPRVLISGTLPPPTGGMATYYRSLLDSSLPERVKVSFVQTSSQTRDFSKSGRGSLSNVILAAQDIARFARAVVRFRPQVAHVATAHGLSFLKHSVMVVIARLAGSRVLLHPHCSFLTLYTRQPRWWQAWFRAVLRMTDGVIALSREWEQVQEVVPGCPVYALPNGVDLSMYQEVSQQRAARLGGAGNGSLKALYLGHLGKEKGSFDLIDAAGQVLRANGNVHFDLVGQELSPGEGAELARYLAAANLNGGVTVHPPAYEEDKLRFFREADIFVYPSYHEGMPMAVLEAMACGLPIVASRVGALPELVRDGQNGLLIDAGRPEQIAAAVEKIAGDEGLRRQMERQSWQMVSEKYSLEEHVAKLERIYRHALEPRGAEDGFAQHI
jgi:glycosyltransferase involved in cell wall biosynthesis